jgi:hypothetical protein
MNVLVFQNVGYANDDKVYVKFEDQYFSQATPAPAPYGDDVIPIWSDENPSSASDAGDTIYGANAANPPVPSPVLPSHFNNPQYDLDNVYFWYHEQSNGPGNCPTMSSMEDRADEYTLSPWTHQGTPPAGERADIGAHEVDDNGGTWFSVDAGNYLYVGYSIHRMPNILPVGQYVADFSVDVDYPLNTAP